MAQKMDAPGTTCLNDQNNEAKWQPKNSENYAFKMGSKQPDNNIAYRTYFMSIQIHSKMVVSVDVFAFTMVEAYVNAITSIKKSQHLKLYRTYLSKTKTS